MAISSSRRPRILLPGLARMRWTEEQKLAMASRAQGLRSAPPFIHPDLSFWNPPADSKPWIITPNPFPAYPAVGAAPVTIIRFVVPAGSLAVVNKLAVVHVGGNPPDGTGQVIWRVLQNKAGIRGLNNLTSQVGTYANPNDIVIVGWENDVLEVTVELPNPNPVGPMPAGSTTAARFHAWTYPLSEATTMQGRSK